MHTRDSTPGGVSVHGEPEPPLSASGRVPRIESTLMAPAPPWRGVYDRGSEAAKRARRSYRESGVRESPSRKAVGDKLRRYTMDERDVGDIALGTETKRREPSSRRYGTTDRRRYEESS
jgi:hypothetical protein